MLRRGIPIVALFVLLVAASAANARVTGGGAPSGGGGGAAPDVTTGVDPGSTGTIAAAGGDPIVSIGAPYAGSWTRSNGCPAAYPSDVCSKPQSHRVHYASLGGVAEARSWATDVYPGDSGAQVRLYARAQSASTPLTATIQRVTSACSSASAHAGQVVVVAIRSGGTKIGSVAYAHVIPAAGITPGHTVDPWGTVLGTVGSGYTSSSCWQGVRTEIELGNVHNYACFNGGWQAWPTQGQRMFEQAVLGYLGGNLSSSSRSACRTNTIYNLAACPMSTMTTPTGWAYPECAADWGGAAFATGTSLACSVETMYLSAHKTGMKIVRNGVVVGSFQDTLNFSGNTHWYVWVSWAPKNGPAGSYQCRVLVDGKVVQTESFTLTGR